MADLKIDGIIAELESDFKDALRKAVDTVIPNAKVDRDYLFKEFQKEICKKFSTYQSVSDDNIRK